MKNNRLINVLFISLILLSCIYLLLFAQINEKEFHKKFKDITINISFKGTDIDDVIKIFAEKMNVNIVRNENVKAQITADLKESNVIDALEIICKINGLNYLVEQSIMSEPIIRIYTQQDYLEALLYKGTAVVIKLKYSKAADIYKKLQDSGAIKGKEGGKYGAGIFYPDEKSNSIIIVDKESSINRNKLREVIEAFDQPIPQVLIEAKILAIALTDETKYGIDWQVLWRANLLIPFGGDVNSEASITRTWQFRDKSGSITGLLTALSEQGDVKVLSNPRIIVLNNEEAKIREGKNEPYKVTISTPSPAGPIDKTDTKFVEVGIGITVTPQINKDNIILKIKPNMSSASERTSTDIAPTVTTSEAETTVSIKNKETLILGGLIQTRQEKIVKKVPLLGSIPILGYLFSYRSYVTKRSELVIFLTPTIIEDGISYKKEIENLKKVEKELEDK